MKKLILSLVSFLFITLNCFASDAVILMKQGQVSVNDKPAAKGMFLSIGDKIEAIGKKSFVQIQFNTGSKIMLRDGALILNKFKPEETELALLKGIIFSYVKKSPKSKFLIKSHNVSMAVRGTKFFVEGSPEDTYLCVCEGLVEMENENGKVEVQAKEDVHASAKSQLKVTKANDMMWDMAKEGFELMNVPVN